MPLKFEKALPSGETEIETIELVRTPLLQRYAFAAVFLLVAAIGAGITYAVYANESAARLARFEVVADEAVDQIRTRVQQHVALVVAAAAYVRANESTIDREGFKTFVEGLKLDDEFGGAQGIGFARIVQPGTEDEASRELAAYYGLERGVWPATDEAIRAVTLMLEPLDARNRAALGYDMYQEARRRAAMSRSINTGETSATAPLTLVQEITSIKQPGFLVYIPIGDPETGRIAGFAYAPFRAGDLHRAALTGQELAVELETRDAEAPGEPMLFMSEGFEARATEGKFEVTRTIPVAGRSWTITLRDSAAFDHSEEAPYTLITGLISLLLATALAAATRWQQQSVERARELNALAERSITEKDLLLQEMKHRIKNSIARISAMARQTASASENIEQFSNSFSARLQSMANAQDMLTKTHFLQTELRELLNVELQQVYGSGLEEVEISGPPVILDGKQIQALGLTFHELATNSLKYGAGALKEGRLTISWKIDRSPDRGRELRFIWDEWTGVRCEPPTRRGFGARLIDTSVGIELGGSIDRDFHDNGLTITLRFPIAATVG